MRVFVTGGTGFIGGYFIRLALESGYEVIALKRSGSENLIKLSQEPEWCESSLTGISDELLSSCDALVHFAAQGVSPQPTDWLTAFDVNVQQSLALMIQADRLGISRIISCGSCFEYGLSGANYDEIPVDAPLAPIGPYASSKAAFAVAMNGLASVSKNSFALLRPFHLYGIGQNASNFWPSLRKAAMSGEDFPMTGGAQIRDFVAVEDVATQFVKTLRGSWPPGSMAIRNIGTGSPMTILEFASLWWERWGAKGELLPGNLPYRTNEVMRYVPKIESAL